MGRFDMPLTVDDLPGCRDRLNAARQIRVDGCERVFLSAACTFAWRRSIHVHGIKHQIRKHDPPLGNDFVLGYAGVAVQIKAVP